MTVQERCATRCGNAGGAALATVAVVVVVGLSWLPVAAQTAEELPPGARTPEAAAPPATVEPQQPERAENVAPGPEAVARDETVAGGVADGVRDPFWPVGYFPRPKTETPATNVVIYTPTPAVEPPVVTDWEGARRQLTIRGFSHIGDKYQAVINDRVVEEGDIVSVRLAGRLYRWKVVAIGPDRVKLDKLEVRD